eukprot:942492-Rhodomonas_salina.1
MDCLGGGIPSVAMKWEDGWGGMERQSDGGTALIDRGSGGGAGRDTQDRKNVSYLVLAVPALRCPLLR